ncbi:MAG: 2OG-Fe(II) oxygenase [Polyangiales bacterium]
MQPSASALSQLARFREEFTRRGRVVIDDFLAPELSEAIAEDLRSLPFTHVKNDGDEREQPPFDNRFFVVEVDPMKRPSPARAFVRSVAQGAIRDFVSSVTGRPGLHNRQGNKHRPVLVAHAYPRGSFLGAHADQAIDLGARRSVALVWHGSRRWEPGWGGQLRFSSPEEVLTPRFGTLHLFDVIKSNRHEVTKVTGPEVRYSLAGWLYELP